MTTTTFSGPGGGFSQRIITSPDGDVIEDRVAVAVGTYNATAPLNSGAWVMQLAAFKAAVLVIPSTFRLFATDTNTVVAAWATASTGFTLQQNSTVAGTNWVDVTNAVSLAGSENQVVIPLSSSQQFYRLKHE